jgi:uncharacterized protein YkwD
MNYLDTLMLIGGIFIIGVSIFGVNQVIIKDNPYANTNSTENEIGYNGNLNENKVLAELYTLTNINRGDDNIQTLDLNDSLENVAQYKANNMKQKDYVSHTSPSGSNLTDRLDKFGLKCKQTGENIGQIHYKREIDVNYEDTTVNYTTEKELAQGINKQFMDRDGNKNNIISRQCDDYGIGLSITKNGKVYVSQIFCGH